MFRCGGFLWTIRLATASVTCPVVVPIRSGSPRRVSVHCRNFNMNTLSTFFACALVAATHTASAQSLLKNSAFDASTDYWDTSTYSGWSDLENYPDGSRNHSGSLLIATSGTDYAEQCTALPAERIYLLRLATLNNAAETDWCSDSGFGVEVTWWLGSDCDFKLVEDDPLLFTALRGQNPYDWIQRQAFLNAPTDANSVGLTLSAGCATHRGTTKMYFDNVALLTDDIFSASFDF